MNTVHKNPRPIFGSSFRPCPWCFAINDWTHKDNEPTLAFACAELGFMMWLYNLQISCLDEEMCIADDDISGAFRLMKCHPKCMALHTSRQCGCAVVNTGGTFGDNASPSNFDPIGMARRQLAQCLWLHNNTATQRMAKCLPTLRMAPPPSREAKDGFVEIKMDSTLECLMARAANWHHRAMCMWTTICTLMWASAWCMPSPPACQPCSGHWAHRTPICLVSLRP